MKYTLIRCIEYRYETLVCELCKKPIQETHIGLGYRDGKGIPVTDKFHSRCAVQMAPALAVELLNKKNKCPNEQIMEIREELEKTKIPENSSLFDEKKWWDSGHLFTIEVNVSDAQKCDLSGEKIETGTLVIKKPYENFFKPYAYIFLLENAIITADFDWENLTARLKISMHENAEVKKKIVDELNRIYQLFPGEQLRNLLEIAEYERRISFNVYGLERQKIKKELLCWDVYFEKIRHKTEQKEIENLFNKFSCTWSNDVHLLLSPGNSKVTSQSFKEEVLNKFKIIKQPVLAAHFCKAGNYRLSRAISYQKSNLVPFPFPFVNHNAFNQSYWKLYIKLKQPAPASVRNKKESIFKSNWMNEHLDFFTDFLWLKITGGYWEDIEQKIENEVYQLNDNYALEMVILNDVNMLSNLSMWGEWSKQFVTNEITNELSVIRDYFNKKREKIVMAFDLEKAYKNATASYKHADEMGDPAAALEGLIEIADKIPYELQSDERVKKINSWIDELTKILD